MTGTIDSRDYTVWFNGMKVTNYVANDQGGWNWKCEGEMLFASIFTSYPMTAPSRAVAIPNSDNGGNGSFEHVVAQGNDNPASPGAVKIETGL